MMDIGEKFGGNGYLVAAVVLPIVLVIVMTMLFQIVGPIGG